MLPPADPLHSHTHISRHGIHWQETRRCHNNHPGRTICHREADGGLELEDVVAGAVCADEDAAVTHVICHSRGQVATAANKRKEGALWYTEYATQQWRTHLLTAVPVSLSSTPMNRPRPRTCAVTHRRIYTAE